MLVQLKADAEHLVSGINACIALGPSRRALHLDKDSELQALHANHIPSIQPSGFKEEDSSFAIVRTHSPMS